MPTEESIKMRALAIAFSRPLNRPQVEGERGSQNQAKVAKQTVPAPTQYPWSFGHEISQIIDDDTPSIQKRNCHEWYLEFLI